jgi:hypothetical protein
MTAKERILRMGRESFIARQFVRYGETTLSLPKQFRIEDPQKLTETRAQALLDIDGGGLAHALWLAQGYIKGYLISPKRGRHG